MRGFMMSDKRPIEELQGYLRGRVLLLAIGNTMRGDDGAGPRLLERLKAEAKGDLLGIDAGPAPERHFGEIEDLKPESIVLLDAVDWGGEPGEAAFFEEESLPSRACTTHDVSLKLVMRYLRLQTGARVGLLGIQPAQTALGAKMTPAVEKTARWLADCLLKELKEVNLGGVCA